MKIFLKNKTAVEDAIREAEGRSKQRLLTHWEIAIGAGKAEEKIDLLPKPKRVGARARVSTGDRVPNAYNGRAQRTYVVLERFPSGWAVVEVGREPCPSASYGKGEDRMAKVFLDSDQMEELSQRWLKQNKIEKKEVQA